MSAGPKEGRARIEALRAAPQPFVQALVAAAEAQLQIAAALACTYHSHDRSRRRPGDYDPRDVVPHAQDPTILVSDAGLDRGPQELLRHLTLELEGTRSSRYDREHAQPHYRNTVQNPLDAYYRRRLLAPEDLTLNKAYWRTGRRLRSDWNAAGYQPRLVGRSYDAGTVAQHQHVQETVGERFDAGDRLIETLRAVPEVPRLCAVAVCCTDQWASDWAKCRPWPKPQNAIHYLRMSLEILRSWYESP
jgi:hypothetical protein